MTIEIDGHIINIGSWNNISGKNLLKLCKFTLEDYTLAKFKVYLLLNLSGLKILQKKPVNGYTWFKYKRKKMLISPFTMHVISESTMSQFFKTNEDGNREIDIRLYRNILSPIRIKLRKYILPDDGLANITFKEFIVADTHFSSYARSKSPEELDKLIATLLRPRKMFFRLRKKLNNYTGDDRQPFNDHHTLINALTVKNLKPEIKQAILFYFIGSRRFIAEYFEHVFTSGSGSGEVPDTFRMYLELVDVLAKHNPTDKEAIRDQMLYDVLDSLNNLIKHQKKDVRP